jgi:hypothetical protein
MAYNCPSGVSCTLAEWDCEGGRATDRLALLPDSKINQALRYMGCPAHERLTQASQKAFGRRDRITEWERFYRERRQDFQVVAGDLRHPFLRKTLDIGHQPTWIHSILPDQSFKRFAVGQDPVILLFGRILFS